jgi:hypothetical protein
MHEQECVHGRDGVGRPHFGTQTMIVFAIGMLIILAIAAFWLRDRDTG